MTDLEKKWGAFESLSFDSQINVVRKALAELSDQWSPFPELLEMFSWAEAPLPEEVTEIYKILLDWTSEVAEAKIAEAKKRLEESRKMILERQKIEAAERQVGIMESEQLLSSFI